MCLIRKWRDFYREGNDKRTGIIDTDGQQPPESI